MEIVLAIMLVVSTVAVTWILATRKLATLKSIVAEKELQLTVENGYLSKMESELQDQKQANKELSEKMLILKEQIGSLTATSNSLAESKRELSDRLKAEDEVVCTLQDKNSRIEALNATLKAEQKEREISHRKQLDQFSEQKKALSQEFENLANKIFEEKGKSFTQTNQNSLGALLGPFKQQIEGFQKRVNDIHMEAIKGNTHLESEIKKVLDVGLKMQGEASNLVSALKGDSQKRGAWGEAQLGRTLEMSGLIEGAHYETQTAFKDLDGKTKQTDYLIKLPDNKQIVIDSKVSLLAYDKAVSAETPEQETLALDEHAKSVKCHIDDLSAKDYTNLIGIRSPSFVLMFMPIEPAYIDALKNKKWDLFSYGYSKNIVLVSHTTLIPILRTVANLWMMERSNLEAREISEKAGDIYNQVCIVAERLQKLGGTLGTVSNHYNNTVKALIGQQGLHGKVERFSQLSNKVTKTMPAVEAIHLDIESDRLELVAEAVGEISMICDDEPVIEGP